MVLAKGVVQIVTGSMSLLQPILSLSTIEFERVAVNIMLKMAFSVLLKGNCREGILIADFTGELRLASPLLDSNIQLNGHLEPDDSFLRSHPREQQIVQRLLQRYKMTVLPFKVGGTVKRPLFRFSK